MTPPAGPALPWRWSVVAVQDLTATVRRAAGQSRPAVVAVDGHSSSGKSTLAPRLATALPDAAVLHTDDIAWNHGVFAWTRCCARRCCRPYGRVVRSTTGRRAGCGTGGRVPWGCRAGCSSWSSRAWVRASRRIADLLDVVVWVETDEPTRLARDLVRVAEQGETTPEDYTSWMAEENAYVTAARPWEAATFVVHGGDLLAHGPDEVVVAGWGALGLDCRAWRHSAAYSGWPCCWGSRCSRPGTAGASAGARWEWRSRSRWCSRSWCCARVPARRS